MNQREATFVDSFIVPSGRDRAAQVLKRRNLDDKARSKFHRWLGEQIAIVPTLAQEMPSSITPSEALALAEEGGPANWWIISTTSTDATEVASETAIGELFDGGGPVVLCNESGAVAMYGTEYPPGIRYLLKRPPDQRLNLQPHRA